MNIAIIRIPAVELQLAPARLGDDSYTSYAANLKRSSSLGRVLGSFDLDK